jgi:putative aldouronate transport system substrate-binding protein
MVEFTKQNVFMYKRVKFQFSLEVIMKDSRVLINGFLVVTTLFLFISCGKTRQEVLAPSTTSSSAQTAPTGDSRSIVLPIVSKPVTLTCFWEADPKALAVIPSYDKMAYFQEMEKRTGIKVEFLHPPAGQTDQQFALMLSTNDLPDMVWYNWTRVPGGVGSIIEDGTIQNLTNWWPDYSPNIKQIYDNNPELRREGLLEDGTFFYYGKIKGDKSILMTTGLQIRADWLERLGLRPPSTIDEWYHVLKAFKTQDANGNGNPNDEIPFVGLGSSSTNTPLVAFAYSWNLAYNDFSTRNNGRTIVFGPLLPEYKEFVQTMAKWYAEGLLDPDYLSTDSKNLEAKVVGNIGGAYMGTINGNMGKFFDTWSADGNKTNDIVPVINPSQVSGGSHYGFIQAMISSDGMAITSHNKYPKESMQYLDYGYSPEGSILSNYGIEGESYIVEGGKPKLTELILKNPNSYPVINALHMYTFSTSQGPGIQFSDTFFQTAIYPRQIEAYVNWTDNLIKINMPALKLPTEDGIRVSKIMGDVRTLVEEKVNKFVMGIEPLDKYDAFVAQLRSMNIEEAIALEQKALDFYNTR